jgi:hypothetical protein
MNKIRKIAWALLIIFVSSLFPCFTFAQEPAYESAHFRFYFDDPSLKDRVSALAEERESFFQFLKGFFPQAKDPEKINCFIYSSWEQAYEQSAQLKEDFVYNVYEEGIFQRSEDIALLIKLSLGESASFLQNGLIKLLWDRFRGIDPHTSTLLLLKENQFYTPYEMMYRPYSIYATCTFSSFLSFLWEKYGQEKLLLLLAGIKDYMLLKGQSYLIPKTIQQIYGKDIDKLTQEWKAYLLALSPPAMDSRSYAVVAEFINRAGSQFFLWMDFPNFTEILHDYGILNYYFDNFDTENASLWLKRIEGDISRSERTWKSLRDPGTYLMWGGIGLGGILLLIAIYFIIMGQINKRRVLALRRQRNREEKNYNEFLEKKLKK